MKNHVTASLLNLRESALITAQIAGIFLGTFVGLFGVLLVTKAPKDIAIITLSIAVPFHALVIIACVSRFLKNKNLTWGGLGFKRPTRRLLHLLWQVPTMLIILLIVQVLFASLTGFNPGTRNDGLRELAGSVSIGVTAALLIGVSLLVPFWEEILFRGVVYGWLRRRRGVVLSIFISGLIFAVAHAIPILIPYFLTMGVLFAYLYEFHKTLWAPFIAHASINTLVSLAVFLVVIQ